MNDDFVEKGMGFGTHPHSNMEIITIPLSGELHHKDSMGNFGAIKREIQVMSAGTGIQHSEFNGSKEQPVTLLQIWVIPNKMGVEPRYDQIKFLTMPLIMNFNRLFLLIPNDEGSWIHQDALVSLRKFHRKSSRTYQVKRRKWSLRFRYFRKCENKGETILGQRDALGITETEHFDLEIDKGF